MRAQDSMGRTALHWAVINNHEEVVQYILKKSPEYRNHDYDIKGLANVKDNHNRTPIFYTLCNKYGSFNNQKILNMLVQMEPDFNIIDKVILFCNLNLMMRIGREKCD